MDPTLGAGLLELPGSERSDGDGRNPIRGKLDPVPVYVSSYPIMTNRH
ncbi:MAG: hypothetical protein WB579_23680 [Bryobacteraceae bacterium]